MIYFESVDNSPLHCVQARRIATTRIGEQVNKAASSIRV